MATSDPPWVKRNWATCLLSMGLSLVLSGLVHVNSSSANSTRANFTRMDASCQEGELQWKRPTPGPAVQKKVTHSSPTGDFRPGYDETDPLYDESLWASEKPPESVPSVDAVEKTFAQSSFVLASANFVSSNTADHREQVELGERQQLQHPDEADRSIRVAIWDDPFDLSDDDRPDDEEPNREGPDDLFEEPLVEETDDMDDQDGSLDREPSQPELEPAEESADPDWEYGLPENKEPQPENGLPSAPDQDDSGASPLPSTLRTIERDDSNRPGLKGPGQEESNTHRLLERGLEDDSTDLLDPFPGEVSEEGKFEDPLIAKEFAESEKNCVEELAQLTSARIDSIDLNIRVAGEPGEDYPYECTLGSDRFSPRSWPQTTYLWKASGLCHKPLYFEQVQLERYGHSWGPYLQPLVSGAHFFATVPILPYKMGLKTPNECVYSLGYYRPGSCAPYLLDPVPFTWRAALFETGFVGGAIGLFP